MSAEDSPIPASRRHVLEYARPQKRRVPSLAWAVIGLTVGLVVPHGLGFVSVILCTLFDYDLSSQYNPVGNGTMVVSAILLISIDAYFVWRGDRLSGLIGLAIGCFASILNALLW